MINIIKAVLEAAETNDFSLKSIDPQEKSYNEETDNLLYKEAYEKACIGIKTCYDVHEKLYREVICNIRDAMGRTNINQDTEKEVELHTISVNPQIDFNVLKLLEDFFTSSDLSKFNSSDEFLTVLECNVVTQRGSDPISKEGYIGPVVTLPMKGILVCENLNKAERNIMNAADELYSIYEFMSGKIVNEKNPMYLEAYARMFEYCAKLISYEIGAYGVAILELLQLGRNILVPGSNQPLTESVSNEENAKKYIDEIGKLIDEIRAFYAKFEYKEIIVPRKKKEPKMYEYVLGALERKYTLKIPIYKVEGVSDDVKDIVEHKFIDKIESITKKYPNFVVLSPNWENESDMFIYITLREPFGDKEDRKDREKQVQNESTDIDSAINRKIAHLQKKIETNEMVQDRCIAKNGYENKSIAEEHDRMCDEMEELCRQRREGTNNTNESVSLNEASLSKAEKDALEDYEFGLPEKRTYPLNDELHINEAIKFFGYCKASDKKTLARNIVRRIIELDLVGVVTITEKHPNKNFFPEWMLNTCKPTLERKGNKYTIYVDGEKVDYGTLENHSSDEEGRIVVVNESGMLF